MSDEIHGCKYYIVGVVPVKVVLDSNGLYMGARIPDWEKGGLKKDASYLSYIMDGDDVTEIDANQFEEECEKKLASKPKKH